MNIISDFWIPVRRRSGRVESIRPADIADQNDPAMALMWPRPDFNLACLELLIGLVYAAMPPEDDDAYLDTVDTDLHKDLVLRMAKLEPWFNLDGDGPRFMQDLEPIEGSVSGIDMLLIDSAGDSAAKKNADMMVRRNRFDRLGQPAAAMALYTLQNFAPAGGAGNRTSMRGGGPLVTLVEPCAGASLWQIIYANTPSGKAVAESQAGQAFPWLSATVNSKPKGSEVHAPMRDDDSVPWSAFFGMPRRLRLQFELSSSECAMTGVTEDITVVGVIQKPYGNNYGVWRHPCSPYYRSKAGEEALPVHPKPGRLGYRQFVGISLQDSQNELRELAACVRWFARGRSSKAKPLLRLVVGGWAMDNMKPVDFIEGFAPLPVDPRSVSVESLAVGLVKAADIAAGQLVSSLKRSLLISESDKGVVADAKAEFYDRTESDFFQALDLLLIDSNKQLVGERWRHVLLENAIFLFDRLSLAGFADRKPERAESIANARKSIFFTLNGFGKNGVSMFNQLDLQPPDVKKARKSTKQTESAE